MDVACGLIHEDGSRCETPAVAMVSLLGGLVPVCSHCIEPGATLITVDEE